LMGDIKRVFHEICSSILMPYPTLGFGSGAIGLQNPRDQDT
jgi:hypothetical protein